MVDKIDRLTTVYNMDGNLESKAAAAAKAVITLKQAQADLGGETQKTEQRLNLTASSAEKLLGKYVQGYSATQQLARDTEKLNQAFNAGKVTAEQHAQAMAGIQVKQKQLTEGFTQTGTAAKLTYTEMQILRSGLINTVQTLASGGNALQTFQTQLFQTAPAFPALARAMGPALIAVGGVAAAVIALGGSMAIVGSRALDLAANTREFGVAIRAMGNDAVTTTDQLQKMVTAMKDQGVAGDDAKAAVLAAARNPRLTQSGMQAVTGGAADFAAAFGGSAGDGAKALTEMATGGYDAIKKLDQAYGFLTASQLNEIRLLSEQGNAAKAAEIAFAALQGRINGAARDSMSTGAKAWLDLKRAVDDLIDSLAKSAPVVYLMERLAAALQAVANAVKNGDVMGLIAGQASMFTGGAPSMLLNAARGQMGGGSAPAWSNDPEGRGAGNGKPLTADMIKASTGKYASDLAIDVNRRAALIGQGAVGQAIGNADIAAKRENAANGISGQEALDVIALRRKEALIQLQDAIARTTALTRIDTAETLKVADAYLKSEGAGRSAMIERQAAADAFSEGVDKEVRAAELRKKAVNEAIVASAQSLFSLRQQVLASGALVIAEGQGADAIRETTIRNRVYAETMNERLALDKADADQRPRLLDLIGKKTALIKEQMENERQAYVIQQQRQANEALEIAGMERQISLLTNVNERRAATIALARRQQEISLANDPRYKDDAERAGMLTKGDQIRALQDQTRFYDEIRQQAQGLAGDVSQFLVDGFVNAEKGGKSAFQNLWDGALAGAKRFIAQLAAQMLQQQILIPIAMQVVGSAPGAFGIANPGGASSGGLGIGDIASVGKNFLPDMGISKAVDAFGAWSGLGASSGIMAGTAAGAASAAGVGTAGAAIAAETGISAFGTAGGALTGAAGLSAAIPYVGAAIAVGSILMSAFGGKKPSVGPGGGVGFGVDASGKAKIGFAVGDNGYDAASKNQDAADAVGAAAVNFFKQIGGTFAGTGVATRGAELGYDAGLKKFTGGDDTSNGRGRFDTIEQAMAASLIAVVKNSIVTGVSKDIQDRIAAVKTSQDMEGLLQYIAGLHQIYDGFKNWAPPMGQAEQAMAALNAAFGQAKSAADSLSQSTDDLQASFKKQQAYLISEFNAPLKERYMRATGQGTAADLFAFDRAAEETRKQAAALGGDAITQAEQTLQVERLAIMMKGVEAQKSAAQQSAEIQAQAFDNVLNSIAQGLNDTISAWRKVASDLTSFRDSLGLSSLSVLDPTKQLELAKSQYSGLLSRAMAGDVNAAQGVQGAAQTLLEKGQGYFASGAGYGDLYGQVTGDIGGLIGWANGGAIAQANAEAAARIAAIRGLPKFADGGFHAGGWAMVGERGPELRYMGASQILSFEDSSRLFRQTISPGNDNAAGAEIRALREEVAQLRREAASNARQVAGAIVEAVLTNTDATRRIAYAQERLAAAPSGGRAV